MRHFFAKHFNPPTFERLVMSFISIWAIVMMIAMASHQFGCVSVPPVTQPTTGPALTPTQQNEINAANQLQAEADLANGVFQIAAAADPSLAPDAMLAAKAHALVDSIVPQYVADVTAGQTPPATLLAQITTDVAQVLSITASHPATAAAYEKAHAGR